MAIPKRRYRPLFPRTCGHARCKRATRCRKAGPKRTCPRLAPGAMLRRVKALQIHLEIEKLKATIKAGEKARASPRKGRRPARRRKVPRRKTRP